MARGYWKLGIPATAGAVLLLLQIPAYASYVNPSLVLSDNQSAQTSTYTVAFTPGLTLTEIQTSGFGQVVALPTGSGAVGGLSAATISVATNTGSGWTTLVAGTGYATPIIGSSNNMAAVNLLPAAFTGMSAVPQVQIAISGLTNPTVSASTGENVCIADTLTSITSTLLNSVTLSGSTFSGLTGLADSACIADTIVPQATNGITGQVNVAPVLNVGVDAAADSFDVTPSASGAGAGSASNAVTVATNALNYTIEAQVSGASSQLVWNGSGGSYSIPFSFTNGSCPSNGSATAFGTSAAGTYADVASGLTGLTNGATTTVHYCWSVDLTKPSGSYTATITYLVVPSF